MSVDVNYDAMMAFAVFAKHRNFTHAAQELSISQPALHQKVTRLAESLELQLYVRDGRILRLTPAGEQLAAHARHVASLTEETLADLLDEQRGATVSIASGPGALLHLIAPRMPLLREGPFAYRLLQMRGRDAARLVREARVQIAVGVFEGRREGLDCSDWFEVQQQLILPQTHRLAGRAQAEIGDLDGEALIVPPEGHPNRDTHEALLSDIAWTPSVEALGYELAMTFVKQGLGLTIANDFVPVPQGLIGIPMVGFPTVMFELAVREGTTHSASLWTRDRLLSSG